MVERMARAAVVLLCLSLARCGGDADPNGGDPTPEPTASPSGLGSSVRVILLHHSTGGNVWEGGVAGWVDSYNQAHAKTYAIEERAYPDEPWPWENYPSDYFRLWVQNQGDAGRPGTERIATLAAQYNVIVFKHCFPGGDIWPDTGAPDAASTEKTLENYQAAYLGLKSKLREFPNVRFILWTLAMRTEQDMDANSGGEQVAMAARARQFVDWTRTVWDERGDNIYLWDFYTLETEGGPYLQNRYAVDPSGDSHPNAGFCATVAPLLGQRIVDVIEGRGDTGSLTGR